MIPLEKLYRMRACSDLLPEPGGEVARELIDEIIALRTVVKEYLEAEDEASEGGSMFLNESQDRYSRTKWILEKWIELPAGKSSA